MAQKKTNRKGFINFAIPIFLTLIVISALIITFNLVEDELEHKELNLSMLEAPEETVDMNFSDFLTAKSYDIYDEYPSEEEDDAYLGFDKNESEDNSNLVQNEFFEKNRTTILDKEEIKSSEDKIEVASIMPNEITTIDKNISENETLEKIKKNLTNTNIPKIAKNTTESIKVEKIEPLEEVKKIPKKVSTEKLTFKKKPKLAIIIDDISFQHQVNSIKKLNLDVTLSFLPPNSTHPKSSKVAQSSNIKNMMIHLPLEALNYPKEEENTIKVADSFEAMRDKVLKIVEKFPNAKYVNNHTGSKFTADKEALKKLLKILNDRGLTFIDSRTTAKTEVENVLKDMNLTYIRRDIFLDNILTESAIKKQLKKAIRVANKKGFAIVICHPHKVTINTLKNSKELLNSVDVVNIYNLESIKG